MSAANGHDLTRWNVASAAIGGGVWLVAALLWLIGKIVLHDLDLLLLFAFAVVVPLVIPLTAANGTPRRTRSLYTHVVVLQPVAAVFGVIAVLAAPATPLALAGALGWLVYTALLAMRGLALITPILWRRRLSLTDLCQALALIYLPIGGIWFALDRLGTRPLGFSQTTVLLTAVHFHFITLGALTLTGWAGHVLQAHPETFLADVYRVAALGVILGPALVAAGITTTQLTGLRALETCAAVLLALSEVVIALLTLRSIVPAIVSPLAKSLLTISSGSVMLTMALAIAYALGMATGAWKITLQQMIALHGWLNALAFSACGLLGWRLALRRQGSLMGGNACASSSQAERD
jgi:YndJ-like protein